jgi:hypothetical protein
VTADGAEQLSSLPTGLAVEPGDLPNAL